MRPGGGCGRFASYNAFPDQNNFDYRSNLNSNLNQISICSSSLTAGVWRIAVQNWGFGPQNFTLNSQLVSTFTRAGKQASYPACASVCFIV